VRVGLYVAALLGPPMLRYRCEDGSTWEVEPAMAQAIAITELRAEVSNLVDELERLSAVVDDLKNKA
jgi:hypothetical protein